MQTPPTLRSSAVPEVAGRTSRSVALRLTTSQTFKTPTATAGLYAPHAQIMGARGGTTTTAATRSSLKMKAAT
ncbi:hypothetical protein FOXG_14870 [Fusarium oxysporum f. sp. lycopersici 4287]|uniref:Uncharacterized protein n=1 Tax=Fusarium oxysporum f. sp. lycopersici (strain 4287 / CBS 123668 / FGSC 9935 / NRRL 34936) TaxID=426428 RepID=A0A0J9W142_FUSO4|nr:hypothetical protein FOXG_14870 [Fusarium oxysporum f. sp. lycopersici 4287]KNB16824.1 hypothetical protein FOXG_14870 [Fusarium oxysporum f. sp. lycopersici 4287]